MKMKLLEDIQEEGQELQYLLGYFLHKSGGGLIRQTPEYGERYYEFTWEKRAYFISDRRTFKGGFHTRAFILSVRPTNGIGVLAFQFAYGHTMVIMDEIKFDTAHEISIDYDFGNFILDILRSCRQDICLFGEINPPEPVPYVEPLSPKMRKILENL